MKFELVMGGTSDEATHQNEKDMVSPWPTIRVPILMSFSFWWVASEGVCSYIALDLLGIKVQVRASCVVLVLFLVGKFPIPSGFRVPWVSLGGIYVSKSALSQSPLP